MLDTRITRLEAWAAWAGVIVLVLWVAFQAFGELERLAQRLDAVELDHATMQQTLQLLEQHYMQADH